MEENKLDTIDVSEKASDTWSYHLREAFKATLFEESAKVVKAWFVGANIPGKTIDPLFYFGGVPTWASWLDKETKTGWESMKFSPSVATDVEG
ncbi:hypothetical protein Z517_07451 [Fonsecaea pedrosoi CBS 271.37]|uniref:Uncharacterized protein n=1 Tax=Fonsecaea pedrosoi CBS 271.37 TaxID=1442368 RepID=A0A0D2H853_9EURO|nr:uncharacterized protein Z517_07451 [Fonsecaea pedrosoi CBS 271.37]KIW80834.1 hypothetical protein Z517_07451 [Fonsecaea pedrosoi CBS 271.37]